MSTDTASLMETIRQFVDEKIAPGVASHGGEVNVISLEKGILTLQLSGACGGCSVQAYTSESIANYLLEEFPDLDDVVVSD